MPLNLPDFAGDWITVRHLTVAPDSNPHILLQANPQRWSFIISPVGGGLNIDFDVDPVAVNSGGSIAIAGGGNQAFDYRTFGALVQHEVRYRATAANFTFLCIEILNRN